MEKMDKLIERIDREIQRHQDKKNELAFNNENIPSMKSVIDTNLQYLDMFRDMALEVKEED